MIDKKKNTKVDAIIQGSKKWSIEMEMLRVIILSCNLTEEIKWGQPCYTLNNSNIILIHGFKDYCALLFFKGALMKDPNDILIQQTNNVQAARQIRFQSAEEIKKQRMSLKDYIKQAIEIEKSGIKMGLKKTAEFEIPEEFKKQLSSNTKLKIAFATLTPGRQRAYLLHFSSAKQSATRVARINKNIALIMQGKGLND